MGEKSEEWLGSWWPCFHSRTSSECSTEWLLWQVPTHFWALSGWRASKSCLWLPDSWPLSMSNVMLAGTAKPSRNYQDSSVSYLLNLWVPCRWSHWSHPSGPRAAAPAAWQRQPISIKVVPMWKAELNSTLTFEGTGFSRGGWWGWHFDLSKVSPCFCWQNDGNPAPNGENDLANLATDL